MYMRHRNFQLSLSIFLHSLNVFFLKAKSTECTKGSWPKEKSRLIETLKLKTFSADF